MAQAVKNMPAMRETQIQSLGQEDPLENGMATHSSILAWRIPWREAPVCGVTKELDTTECLTLSLLILEVLSVNIMSEREESLCY